MQSHYGLPTIWCDYAGYQEGVADVPGFHLYTIKAPLGPEHPEGSTLSLRTILQAGYVPRVVGVEGYPH